MFQYFNIFLIFIAIVSIVILYNVKLTTKNYIIYMKNLEKKINVEKKIVHNLKVELNLLTQPQRLQYFVNKYNKYLNLYKMNPHQIMNFNDIIRIN